MASKLRNVFSKRSDEELNMSNNYSLAEVARYGFPFMPMCICYDPLQSLLAVGTKTGSVRILGRPGVDVQLQHEGDVAVVALQFIINTGQLVSATADDLVHLWDLKYKQPEIVHSLKFQRDRITSLYLPFQSSWLYVGTDKGNVFLVNASKFELSGYSIMWNKTMDLHQKHHPGYVTQILESPVDQSKILIVYEKGRMVLWDLNKKSVEFHYKSNNIKHVSWHHDGKLFMTCHADGSLSVWNVKSQQTPEKSWVPHLKEDINGKVEACQPITKVEWKSSKSSDSIIIFNGGLSACKGSTSSLTLTFSGDEVVTFKLDSPLIDFVVICSTPYSGAVQDPVAVVVLMRDEFVVVDLLHQNLLPFEPAYPFDVHESKVTCCHYLTNCSPDITSMLYSITSKQKKRKFTDKEWPIKGGQWGSPVFSYSEIIITGHEDGSVKFWDATGVTLLMLYKIKTARLFEPGSAESPVGEDNSEILSSFNLNTEDCHPYAVHHLAFCDESKLLCVAGHFHATLFKFSKSETTSDCPIIDINMVFQNFDIHPVNNSGKKSGSEACSPKDEKQTLERVIQTRSGVINWPPGYKPEFCCSLIFNSGKLPSPITSIALNSKYGLLALGNEMGLAVVDVMSKTCLFAYACPDLYGSSDPFSRCPPPLVVNSSADQSDERKACTPVSSTSTENPNKCHKLDTITGAEDSQAQASPSPTSSQDEANLVPKAPPRKKKQTLGAKVTVVSDVDENIQEVKPDASTPLDAVDQTLKLPQVDLPSPNCPAPTAELCSHVMDGKRSYKHEGGVEASNNEKKNSCDAQSCPSNGKICEVNNQPMEKVEVDGVQKENSCLDAKSWLCDKNSLLKGNNLSRVCCCLKETGGDLNANEARLLPSQKDIATSSGQPSLTHPLSSIEVVSEVSDAKSSGTQSLISQEGVCSSNILSLPATATVISSTAPSNPGNPAIPSWRLKFNKFRSHLLHSVAALMMSGPPANTTKAKFQVIDLSDDVPLLYKERSYSAYAKKCQSQLAGEGSTSDEDNIKESILELFFIDSPPYKNEATVVPCLWVGTSLGSVLVFFIETPISNEGPGPSHRPIVAPTGTIFRLKGPIVNISFLDSNFSNVLHPPSIPWKEFEKETRICLERKALEGVTCDSMQHVLLTSDRQIRLIGLPSMNCIQKFKIIDDNYIVQAKAVFIRDSPCLLAHHQKGNIMVLDLPSLKVIQEFNHAIETIPRLSKSFNFSNLGHGMVMRFPTEIQKFVISKGNDNQLLDLSRQLYSPCEVPEYPKIGFFQSLFDIQHQTKLDREALFGESGSGKASKTLAHQVSKMERAQKAATSANSEIAQARLAALERGEKLGELEEKSAMLKTNAESFAQMSAQLKNKYKAKKWYQF